MVQVRAASVDRVQIEYISLLLLLLLLLGTSYELDYFTNEH